MQKPVLKIGENFMDTVENEGLQLSKGQIDELTGLAAGIIADGMVNQSEAEFLRDWLLKYADIVNADSRVNHIFSMIKDVLADGILDGDEDKRVFDCLRAFSDVNVNYTDPVAQKVAEEERIRVLEEAVAHLQTDLDYERAEKEKSISLNKKLSDDKEHLKSENNELKGAISDAKVEASKYKSELRDNKRSEVTREEKQTARSIKILEGIDLFNKTHIVSIPHGHPARSLALRIGIVLKNRGQIDIQFMTQREGNNYKVRLVNFNNREVIVTIRFTDYNRMFVASFRNVDKSFRKKFKEMTGQDDMIFKDRADLSPKQLAQIYEHVMNGADKPNFL